MRFLYFFLLSLLLACFSTHADEIIGNSAAGKTKSVTCATCHGQEGNSAQNPLWPKLAGQSTQYLNKQMLDFKAGPTGGRPNPIMMGIAAPLNKQDIADLSSYYQSLPHTINAANPDLLTLGAKLYRGGDIQKGIPSCSACHGPDAGGNPPAAFPLLSGQHAEYVSAQLKAFRDGTRSNDLNHMMRDIAAKMSDKDIEAVASYIAGLH
jgi:cytochrome c553